MMSHAISASDRQIAILLAPGFEEGDAIYCLGQLREQGFPVSVIGLISGAIRGHHGLSVMTDMSVAQLDCLEKYCLVLVPGGYRATITLLADPRVHRFIEAVKHKGGYLAAMVSAQKMLNQLNVSSSFAAANYLCQEENGCIDNFAQQLIEVLSQDDVSTASNGKSC